MAFEKGGKTVFARMTFFIQKQEIHKNVLLFRKIELD